ncbi:MAG: N-6 DNA methylase [Candidatus Coatesbacteria bacterium]|nr:N-6 DNA methylase [Candidatus Coatesbacteria bacterium]
MTDVLDTAGRTRTKEYITPAPVVEFMIRNSEVRKDARIIDPAAGDGAFVHKLIGEGYRKVWGIEVEQDRADQLRQRLMAYDGFCLLVGDALNPVTLGSWAMGSFDVAIGNPPFSYQKAKISQDEILVNYELGRPKQSIEILFLERFVQMVRPCGLVRIILPMNIFANTALQYVRDFILENLWVEAVIGLPRHTFGGTAAKTAILFGQKRGRDWDTRSDFLNQKRVKLASIRDIKTLSELKTLSIQSAEGGMLVSMADIKNRMDPDYHFAGIELKGAVTESEVEFKPLGELAEIRTGFVKYGEKRKLIHDTLPKTKRLQSKYIRLIKAKNLSIHGFRFGQDDFFIRTDEEIFRSWACLEVGEVLVVRVGAGCVGRAVCVIDEKYRGQADDWMLIVRAKAINPSFLAFYLNSTIGKAFVQKEAQGTGTVSISKGKLQKVLVPVLDESVQREFELEVKSMYDKQFQGKTDKAKAIFNSLDKKLHGLIS